MVRRPCPLDWTHSLRAASLARRPRGSLSLQRAQAAANPFVALDRLTSDPTSWRSSRRPLRSSTTVDRAPLRCVRRLSGQQRVGSGESVRGECALWRPAQPGAARGQPQPPCCLSQPVADRTTAPPPPSACTPRVVLCAQSAKLGTVLRSLGFTPTEADVEDMQGKAGASVNFDALLGFIT
jgi:hypothetical protein